MTDIGFFKVEVHGTRYLVAATSISRAIDITKQRKLPLWRKLFGYEISAEIDHDPVELTPAGVQQKLSMCDLIEVV